MLTVISFMITSILLLWRSHDVRVPWILGSLGFPVSRSGTGSVLSADETSREEDTAVKGMLAIESLPQAFEVLGETGVSGQK